MIPASSATRGTTLDRSSHSAGAWSSPPTGPRPSRVGVPAAVVVFASDAPPVAASRSSNPSSAATSTASSARRAPPSLFSMGRCQPLPSTSTVTSGTSVLGADALDLGLGRLERRELGRTEVDLQLAPLGTTFVRVPPWTTPTFTVTPGQRPFSACSAIDRVRGLEDRVAPLLRFHAGVRRPPVIVDR